MSFVWLWASTFAAEGPAPDDTVEPEAEEVVVTAFRFADAPADVPFSTTVLDADDIGNGRPTLEMGEALALVPGVFVSNRSNFAQDTRLSIRGFGARSAFGIRGIRLVVDGIPLTLPDGQSQVDTLDFANIGRMEVLRGPAGSLYGNAAGGVLVMETKRPTDGPEAEVVNTLGQFGLWKASVAGRTRVDDTDVSLFVSRTAMNGWRDQSSVEHVVAQSHIATQISPTVRWSGNVHYVHAPVADDPGGITPDDFDTAPESAAQTNLDFGTGEDLSQIQIGTRLVATPSPAHQVDIVAHAGLRTFEGRIPFRVIGFDRDFYGGLATYRWRAGNDTLDSQLAVGLEAQAQQDDRREQGNDGGVPDGTSQLDQQERVGSIGVFLQEHLRIADRVTVLGSGRFDRVGFELIDRLTADGDTSGRRNFQQLTGQGGVLVDIVNGLAGFANVSQSFETPTLSELVITTDDGGGLDSDLQAQRALSVEAGVRARGKRFQVEATGFWMGLDNELLRQEDDEGRAFFSNAGRSRRLGAELLARYQVLDQLELLGSYTWLRAEFRDEGRVGDRIPGLPEHRGFVRARFSMEGIHAAAESEFVSPVFATDANDVSTPTHALVGLRAGYTLTRLAPFEVDLTIGVRNLLGVNYVDNVRINAFGDRYFEAGQPRHVYGQLTLALR